MIYKNFADKKLSALGLGCMRLPVQEDKSVDMAATREMVAYAMKHGINYYDTAWGYHDGKSEIVMGEILADYPRESFYLATKFPGYDVSNMEKVEEIFEKQLEKCGVEYFDFYLFHNLSERNVDLYLDPKFGILDYLLRQKANGRIRVKRRNRVEVKQIVRLRQHIFYARAEDEACVHSQYSLL